MRNICCLIGVAACLLGTSTLWGAKPKKDKPRPPRSAVSFELTEPDFVSTQRVPIPWPKELAKVPGLIQVEASIAATTPTDSTHRFFAVEGSLLTRWQKGKSLEVPVHFALPKGTMPSPKQPQYEAVLQLVGYRDDHTKRKFSLFVPLQARVIFPPRLSCTAQVPVTVGVVARPFVNVAYSCTNVGQTAVVLSGFKGDCGKPFLWVFPKSVPIATGATQLITGQLSLPPEPKEYLCVLSFLANGMTPKPPNPVASVRVLPSLVTVLAVQKSTSLQLQGNGGYLLQLPAVPPNGQETTRLQMAWAEPVTVKQVQASLQGEDRDAFHVSSEKGNLSVQFAPKQAKPSYQATASFSVSYEDATQALRIERIQVHLHSTVVVSHQAPLKTRYVDIPVRAQEQCSVEEDGPVLQDLLWMFMNHTPALGTTNDAAAQKKTFFEFNGNLPDVHWNVDDGLKSSVCWFQSIVPYKGTRLLPFTRRGTLDRYERSAQTPTVLEHAVMPLVLQYPHKPLGLLAHAQFVPGVEALQGNALLGLKLELMYQWSYPQNTPDPENGISLRRRKRMLNHLGLTWLMGSSNGSRLPVVAEQSAWDLITAVGATYQGGGTLTDQQNVSLLFHTGMGWEYTRGSQYLQQTPTSNNFYGDLGLQLRVRPSQKTPGLYLTFGVDLSVLVPNKQVRLGAPIGLEVEL